MRVGFWMGRRTTGQHNANAKLKPAQVQAIRLEKGRAKAADVAVRYRISASAVHNIWSGRSYANVGRNGEESG
jgi:hypothetical protein